MRIQKITIKNFRLLENVDLSLEDQTTVIVGRNNSGKTSLSELFRRLLGEGVPSFRLEDFSLSTHKYFWAAFELKQKGADELKIRRSLPIIEVQLTLNYSKALGGFGLLSDFIIDVDPKCTEALITIRYQPENGKIIPFLEGINLGKKKPEGEQKKKFFQIIKERLPKFYKPALFAVDPNDASNQVELNWARLRAVIQSGFINAQRGLDDTTDKENDVLGKVFEALFTTAALDSANPDDSKTAQELIAAIESIQGGIDDKFNEQLINLLPAFKLFGYPGLKDPGLRTETILDVKRILTNHTKIRYSGFNGVHLPESYNGLGPRNLIFILLQLLRFFKEFQARPRAPGVHLVFVEEPEVHLHPQMQEVFIRKLGEIAKVFAAKYNDNKPWPVQFVVSTHSSHIANEAEFEATRYFIAVAKEKLEDGFETKIKDLRTGLSGQPKEDTKFLHQYMTLTRCDLMFADKVVLIEGTTERLLLPQIIRILDKDRSAGSKLSSQYIAVLEVGGAYAHRFFHLLDFLELPALIITDLDTIDTKRKRQACKVSEGDGTSNSCIKDWFGNPKITPADLIKKSSGEKESGIRRLAYQVPEADGKPCGRSFEDAFILANPKLFGLKGDPKKDSDDAWDLAHGVKKSEFALKYAIEETAWAIPRYIKEGLSWLADKNSGLMVSMTPVSRKPPTAATKKTKAAKPAKSND